jgi:predicted MFS family arabinose efflux permease
MGLPARPIVGYVADKYIGPINAFAILQAIFAAILFGWIGVRTRTDMYVFSAFLGIITGASQGIFLGALASLTKDPRKMGTRFGMVATICAFGTLAGPPTGGAIIDHMGGQYVGAQLWVGGVMLCSSLTIAASRLAATGLTWKAKI